jgi:uncharacterized membrane protein YdjX (TVP38/TMEM64 family)
MSTQSLHLPVKILAFLSRHRRLVIALLFLATLFALAQGTGLRQGFSLTFLRQELSENQWSGLAVFVLLFATGNLVQVPGWLFLVAAVLVLGKAGGGLATYVAASTSCGVTFLMVRWIGGDAVRQLDGKLAARLVGHLHAYPIRNVVILRTLFQTLPALNYTLAMSGIGFRKYMAGTLLGLPLPIAVYCVFFDYVCRLLNIA